MITSFLLKKRIILSGIPGCFYLPGLYFFVGIMEKIVRAATRASVSIPANIAEGFSKKTKADKARFYNISKSSLEEVRYYLILSGDLGYIANSNLFTQLEEISRLLHSYFVEHTRSYTRILYSQLIGFPEPFNATVWFFFMLLCLIFRQSCLKVDCSSTGFPPLL